MRLHILKKLLISFVFIVCFCGCTIKIANYAEFEKYSDPTGKSNIRLPVILVPGIKGSVLERNGETLWGKSYRVMFLWKYDELQFKLKPQLGQNFEENFSAEYKEMNMKTEIMEDYRIDIFGLNLFKISIYHKIRDFLMKTGGYSIDTDLFLFSYDWRLDNRISAVLLAKKVINVQKDYKAFLKKALGESVFNKKWDELKVKGLVVNDQIKVNIIAHSMGGLVSRYYLQILGGSKYVKKLILFGTPNLGAADSMKALAEGEYPESIFHFYHKVRTRPIIFSWPSVYQLLPRYSGSLKNKDEVILSAEKLNNWGLSTTEMNTENLENAYNNWKNYNLIPKSLGEDNWIIKTFLREQLDDALKFHCAINGKINKSYEENKLKSIQVFLNKTGQNNENLISDLKNNTISKITENDKSKSNQNKISIIIFGGYCEPTTKTAKISNGNHIEFDTLKDKKSFRVIVPMGDGRVPVESLAPKDEEKVGDFQFMICEDHIGLVTNDTFQYNLLHELLGPTNFINQEKELKE